MLVILMTLHCTQALDAIKPYTHKSRPHACQQSNAPGKIYDMNCLAHSMYTVPPGIVLMLAHDKPTSASSRKSLAPGSSLSNRSSPPIWTIFKGELHSAKSAWANIWAAERSASRSAGRHTNIVTPKSGACVAKHPVKDHVCLDQCV